MMTNKRCAFILPYFGKFNNYFPLFLRTCGKNHLYDWLIFTDNTVPYDYPQNVKVIKIKLEEVKKTAEEKFGFPVCLKTPYKLCDYKPAYGFLFEEYVEDYEYWGHCDCDLIFGNLDKILTPLLDQGYEKLFAAGHLTLYNNNNSNNRRFMQPYKSRLLYKEAFTTDRICAFDEDLFEDNVHSIFVEDGASIYSIDLAMNASIKSAAYVRDYYDHHKKKFQKEEYRPARYYWNDGDIVSVSVERQTKKLLVEQYLYMHFQMRKMRLAKQVVNGNLIQILPDRFILAKIIPKDERKMNLLTIKFPYLYWIDVYIKKIQRRIKSWR